MLTAVIDYTFRNTSRLMIGRERDVSVGRGADVVSRDAGFESNPLRRVCVSLNNDPLRRVCVSLNNDPLRIVCVSLNNDPLRRVCVSLNNDALVESVCP